ncbi:hypothetical protein ACFPRL_32890 [Pseudoclavibacter helvolus]
MREHAHERWCGRGEALRVLDRHGRHAVEQCWCLSGVGALGECGRDRDGELHVGLDAGGGGVAHRVAGEEHVGDDVGHDLVEAPLVRLLGSLCSLGARAGVVDSAPERAPASGCRCSVCGFIAAVECSSGFRSRFDDRERLLAHSVPDCVRDERIGRDPEDAHPVTQILHGRAALSLRSCVALVDGLPGELFRDPLRRLLQRPRCSGSCRMRSSITSTYKARRSACSLGSSWLTLNPTSTSFCTWAGVATFLSSATTRGEVVARFRRERHLSLRDACGDLHDQRDLVRDRADMHGGLRASVGHVERVPEVVGCRVGP